MSTPVQIIWFIGETERNVGIYNPLNVTNFHTSINTSDLPKDRLDNVYVLIPLPVAIVLYVAAAAVVIFTTIQLVLYMTFTITIARSSGLHSIPQQCLLAATYSV